MLAARPTVIFLRVVHLAGEVFFRFALVLPLVFFSYRHLQPPWRLLKDVDTSTSAVEQRRSSCSIIHARTRRLLHRHNA
jgi:hypothetical protein